MGNTPDHPPPGLSREGMVAWRAAFHARRAAIVAGAATWQESALRLHAAGELSAGMLGALGLARPAGSPVEKKDRQPSSFDLPSKSG